MTFRKSILLLISLSMIAALLACGSSSSPSTTTPPPVTGPLPDGNYVFSLIGEDAASGQYSLAGVFTVSLGSITTGEQDFVDFPNSTHSDQINPTGSSVAANADGNLTITLVTCSGTTCTGANDTDANVGLSGTETLDASLLPNNPAKAFIIEFDASATSSGELDLQTSTTLPTLPVGYAFISTGLDSNFCPTALGGVINISGATTISAADSVFDANDCGVPLADQGFTPASSVAGPDTFGRLEFQLVPAANYAQINVVGYIVSQNQIDLVETTDGNQNFGTTSGIAFSQGTNTDNFNTASASGNTYVVGLNGGDSVGVLQAVTQITPNADSSVSGFIDFNDLTAPEPPSPDPIAAPATQPPAPPAYAVDRTGRVTITGLADSAIPPNIFDIQLYLDGNGHALAISLDSNQYLAGIGYQQSGAGSFAFTGAYAMGATGWDVNEQGELDAVGPVTVTGNSGTFSGDVDLNWLPGATPTDQDAAVSGTFVTSDAAAANGIFTGTITGVDVTTCPIFTPGGTCTADVFNFYLIDAAGDNIAIETDAEQLTLGVFAQK